MTLFEFIALNYRQILSLLGDHIQLTVISVGLAVLIGVPLGILIIHYKSMNRPVLGTANIIQAIPSMALLGFAVPFLGIGALPAVSVVILYSLLPIIKNTYTGIGNINPQMIEAAKGIGLTEFQVLWKVQIPLALPVIMAGVRISAVTAVGLMTIAAFIGAGGLGFLVFSGIRTVNNNQILAGAIPACLLALLVDFLIGKVEKLVTPKGIQPAQKVKGNAKGGYAKAIVGVAIAAVSVLFIVTYMTRPVRQAKEISVGGKDFTEQMIIVNLVADMIEDRTHISVIRRPGLGGTQVCFGALKGGDIDLYVEYSGTAYGDTLGYPPISDVRQVYDTAKREFKDQFNIEVLKQFSFNNTYALAVRPETAERYKLRTFSDLVTTAHELRIGGTLEFLNRKDGIVGLQEKYGFTFGQAIGLDGSQRYIAIMSGNSDVVDAFSTDALLKKFKLITLEDDRHFFPPYYAMPIARATIIEKYPEIVPVLEELGACLTEEVMIDLNYQVDELQKQPPEVARDFLLEKRLIRAGK